jgi:hypothetical protein
MTETWWIKFSDRGIARRESSHLTDYTVAEKLLKKRLAETLTQTYAPSVNVKVDKLIEDVFIDYRNQNRKSLVDVKRRWKLHLMPWFRNRKASDLTTDCINAYIEKRKVESIKDVLADKQEKALKACAATINRELGSLKYAFNLRRTQRRRFDFPRSTENGSDEHVASRDQRQSGNDDFRPLDPEHLRQVQNCAPERPERCGGARWKSANAKHWRNQNSGRVWAELHQKTLEEKIVPPLAPLPN